MTSDPWSIAPVCSSVLRCHNGFGMSDLYQVLGVGRHAGHEDIKRSYRRVVRECHPDLNPTYDAEVRFKRVSIAYAVLSDPKQRALYDEFGEESLQPGFDPMLVRRQSARPQSRASQSPFGDMSAFEQVMGSIFSGSAGEEEPAPAPAREADRGQDETLYAQVPALLTFVGGTTTVPVTRPGGRVDSVRIRIKPGVQSGDTVRLSGHGASVSYGVPGDLTVVLDVQEHALIRRTGDDLEMDVPITLLEAVQGGPINVPTPLGPARVNLPANCAGAKLRLRGRGVQRAGTPGHLILHLRPVLPDRIDGDVMEACRAIERAYAGDPRDRIRI